MANRIGSSNIVVAAHNLLTQTNMFYAQALGLAGEWAAAEEEKAKQLEAKLKASQEELVIARAKVDAAEGERDDLRSELCRLRSQLEAIEAAKADGDPTGDVQLRLLREQLEESEAARLRLTNAFEAIEQKQKAEEA